MAAHRIAVVDCGADVTTLGLFRRTRGAEWNLESATNETLTVPTTSSAAWTAATAAAIAALLRQAGWKGEVTLVLPAAATLLKAVRTPNVPPAQRARVIAFEAAQALPYGAEDAIWASTLAGEIDGQLEFLLGVVRRELVTNLVAAIEAAGCRAGLIVPAALALRAEHVARRTASRPELVVSVEAGGATFLLAEAGRFQVRSALFALGAPGALAAEAGRTLAHFLRRGGLRPESLAVAGLDAADATRLGTELQLPVSVLDAEERRAANPAVRIELRGAVRLTAERGERFDLRPAESRAAAQNRARLGWYAAAAALTVAALLPPWLHFHREAVAARAQLAAVEAEIAPQRERAARLRQTLAERDVWRERLAAAHEIEAGRTAWLGLMADLQGRFVRVEDAWLDRLQVEVVAGENPGAGALRLSLSGRMLDRTNPLAQVSPDIYRRVKALLGDLAASPYVAAVEGERFDPSQPGILRFDCVVVLDRAKYL